MRRAIPILASLLLASMLAVPARAEVAGVCATEPTYLACGRVFPDPWGGLPFDPNAEGRVPAADFIQYGTPGEPGGSEIWDGLSFLESRYERYLDVWTLDELLDEPDARSAGLWLGGRRQRLPLILARVTDETVPDDDKLRFVFALSLHGIERAGAEGGTRALEDLVTYAHCESLGSLEAARADAACANQTHVKRGAFVEGAGGFPARLLPWDADSLTMGEALRGSELYFAYVNPDGWHRGDKASFGGVGHYQRYNGNGVDPNRDWPTRGFTFGPYTPGSEPETKYFMEALRSRGGNWGGGIDLHGMHFAPVLTYTMLPAGQHDYRKNQRIRSVAQRTQRDALERLSWSKLIDSGEGTPPVRDFFFGQVVPMGPQQWGTVWDTIDYTITGSLGDWINSPGIGLGGIGMDNEMALSHISNCGIGTCFVPEIEQLHVAGNKGLIYADIDTTLRTHDADYRFPFRARGAYLAHSDRVSSPAAPRSSLRGLRALDPQAAITGQLACSGLGPTRDATCITEPFEILGPRDDVYNAGVTVDAGFAGPHALNDETGGSIQLQRRARDHAGDDPEWVTVADNYTGGQLYLPNGMTAAANDPVPGTYRLRLSTVPPGPYFYEVRFSPAPAFDDPGQRAYDASNLEFFEELNRYLPRSDRLRGLSAADVAGGALDGFDVVVIPEPDARAMLPRPGSDGDAPRPPADRILPAATLAALERFARDGGTVVLLDGALSLLDDVSGVPGLEGAPILEYAGWIGFNDGEGPTYDDPLARGVNVPGAAEGDGNRHQTYEPVPLGFYIGDGFIGGVDEAAPVWGVDAEALRRAKGRIAGMSGGAGVTLGELKLGKGSIRFAGAMLPTPSQETDHPFGLSSYALTYTGWQLIENLLAVRARPAAEPRVLGERELPRTGAEAGLIIAVVAMAAAFVIARRLRDVFWI